MTFDFDLGIQIMGSILVFCLVFGMSATADVKSIQTHLQNKKAILTGVLLQFILMPLLGLTFVKTFEFDKVTGLTLLVVTSSPGGSFSNWWCSIANADLALSVTMTAISTLLSVLMLPVNLLVYTHLTYGEEAVENVNWTSMQVTLAIVITAIGLGLYASYHNSTHDFHMNANRLGNFAGVALILFSAIMSFNKAEKYVWNRDSSFYIGIAAPCVVGLVVSSIVSSSLRLLKPECVTISIECCYQNVGIATIAAMAMFDEDDLSEAVSVPFYYGCVEAALLSIYCLGAWKAGWTKAPSTISLCHAVSTSYEVIAQKDYTYPTGGSGSKSNASPNKNLQEAFSEKGVTDSCGYVQHLDTPPNQIELCNKKMEKQKRGMLAKVGEHSGDDDQNGYVLDMA